MVVDGGSPQIPKLRWRDRRTVISRLNELFDMLKGDVHMHLRWLMFAAHLDKVILRMLESRKDADRRIGIESAGRLRMRAAIGRITAQISDPRADQSMHAARALVRIDADLGVKRTIAEFMRRTDWEVTRTASILADGRGVIRFALAEAVKHASFEDRSRVIELIEATRDEAGARAIRDLLAYRVSHDRVGPDGIATAIRALATFHDPQDADLIKRFEDYPDEEVKRAASAARSV